MNTTTLEPLEKLRPVSTPDQIAAELPATGDYATHYQPSYPDPRALTEAIAEVQQTESVTSRENIQATRQALAKAALNGFIVLDGSCAEPIRLRTPIQDLVDETIRTNEAIQASDIGHIFGDLVLCIKRNRGQSVKPRSSGTEVVTEENQTEAVKAGQIVASFMGDGVNGEAVDQRTPRPDNMVAMAVQARDLEAELTTALGHHVPAAHEALLLAYEKARTAEDSTGRRYLLSADVPWIGARTNSLDGAHVQLLTGIENAVGVKISDSSDEAHIMGLAKALNPHDEEGKLIFMMRVGSDKEERLDHVLNAIHDHAPNAIVMYDIHGVTKTIDGQKIRAVPDIIREIIELTEACNKHGLRMSGVHLETMGDNNQFECVNNLGEKPTRPGYVDPRLNPMQLKAVLDAIANTVLNQELGTPETS